MAVIQEIKVPLLAVNDTELTVVDILFSQGAAVQQGAVLMVFETSKTTYDVLAEADGFIGFECRVGQDYPVNTVVARIYSAQEEVPVQQAASQPAITTEAFTEAPGHYEGNTLFSAAAMELIRLHALDAASFSGMEMVSRADVEARLGLRKPAREALPSVASPILPVDPDKVTVERLASSKKREIAFLSSVQHAGLRSTVHTAVNTRGIFTHLNQSFEILRNALLPVVCYEAARLLQRYPLLNGYFTGEEIALYREVQLGFAMDAGKGLKVLRIADAGQKSMAEIEQDILRLSEKYLADQLELQDLTDISFTITDLSAEEVFQFTPLVNQMNSAILGISSVDPVLQRCMLSVSFDHRVTEGRLVARFLAELKKNLESYRAVQAPLPNQDIQCYKCRKTLAEDLSKTGFARCITPQGDEGFICQVCFKGF